jgi:hypothetical protein
MGIYCNTVTIQNDMIWYHGDINGYMIQYKIINGNTLDNVLNHAKPTAITSNCAGSFSLNLGWFASWACHT